MTYRIDIQYQASKWETAGEVDSHPNLTKEMAEAGMQAFLRDLFELEGQGVASVTISVERQDEE